MSLNITRIHDPAELETVETLAREIWNEFYVPLIGRAQVDYMVERFQTARAMAAQLQQGYEYYLVSRDDRPIGYCAVQPQPDERTLFLSKFYLHRDARGTGTGRALMAFIEQLAEVRGLVSIWLTVNKGNPSVQAYERLGFRIAAELRIDIGQGFVMDDFRMEKSLDSHRAGPL
jgi:GNAT superfamily N-acetyltransferase